jgi:hypothetical protein
MQNNTILSKQKKSAGLGNRGVERLRQANQCSAFGEVLGDVIWAAFSLQVKQFYPI